jgi:hypothetical protein
MKITSVASVAGWEIFCLGAVMVRPVLSTYPALGSDLSFLAVVVGSVQVVQVVRRAVGPWADLRVEITTARVPVGTRTVDGEVCEFLLVVGYVFL